MLSRASLITSKYTLLIFSILCPKPPDPLVSFRRPWPWTYSYGCRNCPCLVTAIFLCYGFRSGFLPWGLPSMVSSLLQEDGLGFDFGFCISGFLLPCSLVSKHHSPGINPTWSTPPRLGTQTPPSPAQVQCLRFLLCGRKDQTEWHCSGLLGLQLALPKSASSQLHHPEPNPGSLPGALDCGQRQGGSKVPLSDPGELTATAVRDTCIVLFPSLTIYAVLLSIMVYFWGGGIIWFPATCKFSFSADRLVCKVSVCGCNYLIAQSMLVEHLHPYTECSFPNHHPTNTTCEAWYFWLL